MKNTIKILFFVISIFYFFITSAWYKINDLWDTYENINDIDWYQWSFWNAKSWFLWNNNSFLKSKNIKVINWFFDENKKTLITKIDIEYLYNLWYVWNKYIFENHNDIQSIKWFFDINKVTKITNKNPIYNSPVWFLWQFKWFEKEDIKNKKKNKIISYHDLLKQTILEETVLYWFNHKIYNNEYRIFIQNILSIILKEKNMYLINWEIDDVKKNIKSTKLISKIKVLLNNAKEFNSNFKKLKTEKEKIYLLKYYLN